MAKINTDCKYQGSKPTDAHHYTMCGLDYVYLINGYELLEDEDFGESIIIHNADRLHMEIGRNIVLHREKLSAKELRFLRALLDLTQKELAEMLDVTSRTVQRWENSKEESLPSAAEESLIRIMFWDKFIGDEKAMDVLEKIKRSRKHYEYFQFMESHEEWKLAA